MERYSPPSPPLPIFANSSPSTPSEADTRGSGWVDIFVYRRGVAFRQWKRRGYTRFWAEGPGTRLFSLFFSLDRLTTRRKQKQGEGLNLIRLWVNGEEPSSKNVCKVKGKMGAWFLLVLSRERGESRNRREEGKSL